MMAENLAGRSVSIPAAHSVAQLVAQRGESWDGHWAASMAGKMAAM